MKCIIYRSIVFALLSLNIAYASPSKTPPEKLEDYDLMKTCKTPEQVEAAEKALAFLNDFHWWNVRGMYDAVHDDYRGWHASWSHTYLRSSQWTDAQKAIFPAFGQFNKNNLMKALAYSAYTNDVGEYILKLKRVDCLEPVDLGKKQNEKHEGQKIVISSDFHGTIVLRDDAWGGKGFVRFVEKIVEPTKITFSFRDGMISETLFDLRDETGDEVAAKLINKLMDYKNGKGQMDVIKDDPARRGSFLEIYNCFLSEIDPSKICTLKSFN